LFWLDDHAAETLKGGNDAVYREMRAIEQRLAKAVRETETAAESEYRRGHAVTGATLPGINGEGVLPWGGEGSNRVSEGAGNLSGPVEITPPPKATSEQIAHTKAYIAGANQALQAGRLSPTGRVSTKGRLRYQASESADREKLRAAAAGIPYKGHAGHVPDTTWTGTAEPFSWLDLDPSVNLSIGGQVKRYPIGYKPTEFRFKDR
jgi:hypothetical protein